MNSVINLFIQQTLTDYLPCDSALKGTWDLFESGVMRHADMKMIVMKEEVYTQSPRIRRHGTACHAGSHQCQSRGRGSEGITQARVLLWFLQKDLMR